MRTAASTCDDVHVRQYRTFQLVSFQKNGKRVDTACGLRYTWSCWKEEKRRNSSTFVYILKSSRLGCTYTCICNGECVRMPKSRVFHLATKQSSKACDTDGATELLGDDKRGGLLECRQCCRSKVLTSALAVCAFLRRRLENEVREKTKQTFSQCRVTLPK